MRGTYELPLKESPALKGVRGQKQKVTKNK